jgi:hypothetical protein
MNKLSSDEKSSKSLSLIDYNEEYEDYLAKIGAIP